MLHKSVNMWCMAELLDETKIDQSKVYFHGSSEARVNQLKAPSARHPFYVTPDLHYAMAFCTKDDSQTGDYEDEDKIYTPASQNFVYCVSLKPTCKAFDFRDHSSTEFKKLYKVIDQELVGWVVKRNSRSFDMSDIFEFVAALQGSVVKLVDMSRANYLEYTKLFGVEPELMTPKLFSKACAFCKKNGLYETWGDFSVHQTMAPILEGLKKQGFHAILTRETDFNDEDSTKPSAKVSTSYALGIFDKAGIDLVSLVPLRYNWLKRINPTYLQDRTEASAGEKIERFIKLYKKITEPKNLEESVVEAEETWYFGNNRSKNLKIAKPSWDAPFFLTTSYEYAEDYSDYGVYKIELIDQRDLNILDFNNKEEVQKLGWPEVLADKILEGGNDLNGLAYDLYLLASGSTDGLIYIQGTDEWLDAAIWFQDRSEDIFKLVKSKGIWGSEKDHQFLLQMWKDIYDAGFAGFTHQEFGHKILALFDLKCIEKISTSPVVLESYEPPYTLAQIKAQYPEEVYNKLSRCPVHSWRSETGIELVHKEPTEEELDRVWKNWQLMPQELKDKSDEKSLELFGCTNAEHYPKLKAEWAAKRLDENKAAYLKKFQEEPDVKTVTDQFWIIRSRVKAPMNDIDWWIKKPYSEFKNFVLSFDTRNKSERREEDWRQNAINNDAKLLGTKDGYEMWYTPTYDSMRILGRFYKGRSAKWCVASDDPDFWFDNHEDSEFVVLIREHPQHDEFDKVAIEMMNHGRYYNEDDIIPWDLENEDWTFTNDELIHEAWLLFKDNGETREQYFG